jgi:hypothetical protein
MLPLYVHQVRMPANMDAYGSHAIDKCVSISTVTTMATLRTWHERFCADDADLGDDPIPFAWGGGEEIGALVLLHAAATANSDALRDALDAGISPDVEGLLGPGTALLIASARGYEAIVTELLAAGARLDVGRDGDVVTARDPDADCVVELEVFLPEAPQSLAAAGGHHAMVQLLDDAAAARAPQAGR